ncbi:MAG: D-glycero-beta-D-manno-heptose 1-phosphate adenylyltransferase [Marinilabiliales bacterium]|nr:MAG: D-glycero-beta-D-manno-heptose 1-phosphate adenylyltransferase [Marinilabiliales bacterium]
MKKSQIIKKKIMSTDQAVEKVKKWKDEGKSVVFTNGCFDIIHPGHSDYLSKASDLGDKLVLGLNTDSSVSRLKGTSRPVIGENDRARLLASFEFVDAIVFFDEDTPANLIDAIIPDVLVKGKDYEVKDIVGADTVLKHGGRVETIELTDGFSTSDLIRKIKAM